MDNFVIGTADDGVMFPEIGIQSSFGMGFTYNVECYDKHGNLRWRDAAKNIIPTIGLNDILNVYYAVGSQSAAWYLGMVDNAGFTAFNSTDTMASHSGWTENTNTSLPSRPVWTPSAASGASISNGTAVTVTMNPSTTCTIKGFFLANNNTLGGTSGLLSSEAALGTPQLCNPGDTLKVTMINAATTS